MLIYPQVKLYPRGDKSKDPAAELLICFELLKKKDLDLLFHAKKEKQLGAAPLRPLNLQPASSYELLKSSPSSYIAFMRRVTIRFALLGLRDLRGSKTLLGGFNSVSQPHVVLTVQNIGNGRRKNWSRSMAYRERYKDGKKPEVGRELVRWC